ncbi:4-hydroxy-2-oxoheptanedioate aldolase [Parapusillimonas granuli]|uniref:4-hydroxy-2-oxoheptanedioate aldolase n=1 Tax=Parapusillimonas granuli TaxID=380911 RepID=A0A853G5A9_9BURK|nr:4-hydroxy-2-oxoheptanedioate aldolase [Parapusillimonas granuli]MBB5216432.1 4-hydroxy-2-oxoheptanedioate aldolase [Parapusillimonas granuli]MEB2399844.1 4-hydroxy-2-oxoheptanedioate aldolase [Alcaligenaceae bacterium]NYT51499.1 4-hydroxy-2-oxoheptanedioate aldolase [Parapusillimonas granuli]
MQIPVNRFKQAINAGQHQLGLWVSLAHHYSAEIVARAGFDWLVFDTEHSPNDVQTVLGQLQAAAPYPVSPVVRPSWNDLVQQKRYLDIGAQTLLIPYVQSVEEAEQAVSGMRYPPRGMRGVGGVMRASGFGQVNNYMQVCEDQLCLLVQVETREGLDRLEDIAKVDGVDGVFIGPADLSASLGHPGDPKHPEVQSAIEDAIRRIRACGKAPGILTVDEAAARRYMEVGTLFTAVGLDAALLARNAEQLAARFRA